MTIKAKPRIYLDSNVFISCIREELGRGFRLLGQESESFFAACHEAEAVLLLSELFFEEVEKVVGLGKDDVLETLENFGLKTETVKPEVKKSQLGALRQQGMHNLDAVHLACALACGADLLATWNKKHFSAATGLITVLEPPEFTGHISQHTS